MWNLPLTESFQTGTIVQQLLEESIENNVKLWNMGYFFFFLVNLMRKLIKGICR